MFDAFRVAAKALSDLGEISGKRSAVSLAEVRRQDAVGPKLRDLQILDAFPTEVVEHDDDHRDVVLGCHRQLLNGLEKTAVTDQGDDLPVWRRKLCADRARHFKAHRRKTAGGDVLGGSVNGKFREDLALR